MLRKKKVWFCVVSHGNVLDSDISHDTIFNIIKLYVVKLKTVSPKIHVDFGTQ